MNLTFLNGGGYGAGDFPSLMQSITNGSWTIQVTNATSTNIYSFTVSAPVFPADLLSPLAITFPVQGTSNVVNQPDFAWQGPTGWQATLQVSDSTNDAGGNSHYVTGAVLPPAASSWASPVTLPNGTNSFNVTYLSILTNQIVATTPLDSSSVPISTWTSTATLEEDANSVFSVGGGSPGEGTMSHGHTLVAHYTFDDPDAKATDSSGNGNSFSRLPSYWGSSIQQYSTDAAAGAGAIQFFGESAFWTFSTDPGNLFSNLVSTLAGSFSVSLWLNTGNIVGSDTDDAQDGAEVMDAFNYNSPGADGVIPVAITGSKLAFYTGDGSGTGDTLHSVSTVVNNNDSYVHVVVTRDQGSGQKLIYINGALDASGTGSLDSLNGDTNYFALGGVSGHGYTGLLDDVQIYAGVLGGEEVAYLFQNPGATMANASASGLVASYDFDEGNPVATDVSGHSNNLVLGGSFGSGSGPAISSDSVSGSGSVSFDGGSFLSAPPTLLPVVAGTFSISLWVKTGQTMGQPNNGSFLGGGEGIVAADVPGLAEDLVPVCLTGGVIGFNTGGSEDDTLYSTFPINDNSWHHVVVTRDQSTGLKQIFIDGSPNAAQAATTDLLTQPQLLVLGCVTDSSNPDPASPEQNGVSGYVGLLDDLQVYDRVLLPSEVAYLFLNPANPVKVVPASGIVAYYDFDEGIALAPDVSGNGNNLVQAGAFGGGGGPSIVSDSISGAGSVFFDGGSFLSAPTNLLTVLASNFSVSLWINTGQNMGQSNNGSFLGGGAGIVAADVPGLARDLVPVCLPGGVIGFNTGGTEDDTLYSATSVIDNSWHHVVVTRDQATGMKQIFIDGSPSASGTGATGLLNAPQLLVLGCVTDSSNPDPASPAQNGVSGYNGELDDVQIYNRVLRRDEVVYLENNPGTSLPNTNYYYGSAPVTVDLTLTIGLTVDPVYGTYYFLFPGIGPVSPAVITSNTVSSPHGSFYADSTGSASSLEMSTLNNVINECTNGPWQFYVNKGDPSQQLFTFTLACSGLTTSILSPVTILSPTNGGTNIAANPLFAWSGPTNYSAVYVNLYLAGGANEGNVSLPGTATTWPSPPVLSSGMNRFEVTFSTNDIPQVTFSTPTNQIGIPMAGFTTHVDLNSFAASQFVVGQSLTPVQLINVQSAAGATQFQFLSQAGVTNTVQSRTNLTLGNWQPRGDIPGDGTLKTVNIPATNGPVEFYRILSHQ